MSNASFTAKGDLLYKPQLLRNRGNRLLTGIAGAFALIAVIPLIAVILFVLIKGFTFLRPAMFFELPPVPGQDMGGGIGNRAIPGAPAQIALEPLAHVGFVRVRHLVE